MPLQVVQAIGAAETKLFDFGAPKRIDGEAAIKLVNVAKDLGVTQYIMVTSLGTGKIGFPASRCHRFCPFTQILPSSNRFCPSSDRFYPIQTGFDQCDSPQLSPSSILDAIAL